MPELPEVETVRRGLEKVLPGRKIASVTVNRRDLRIPFPPRLKEIAGNKVLGIGRRAKYLLLPLSGGQTLIIHLGMSGRLLLEDTARAPEKHDHMLIVMEGGTRVTFNDPRRFGLVTLCADVATHKLFTHLGPEPLEKEFSPACLAAKLKGKKIAVKLAIMDQRLVVGVGNIYASEALYMAGIDPRRAAATITAAEGRKLVAAIKAVLKKAIAAGGSSLRDYVQTDGELGYFQHQFAVYGRAGEKCRCKKGAIAQITQGGRSTFYCPACQR